MAMRKILVDETNRELCEHGTVGFPMTVNHDDLWAFEGKSVPIHWHNDLEISLPREGEAIYQVYRKSSTGRPDSSVQRGLLPPVQKNDRQDNYRLSGRISCQPKSATGSELPIFYDPDCRYDRLQQRQPFCPGIPPTIRMQSR